MEGVIPPRGSRPRGFLTQKIMKMKKSHIRQCKPSYMELAIYLLILFFAFSDNTYVSTFIGLSDVISLIPR